jgi:HEAT repeat protein
VIQHDFIGQAQFFFARVRVRIYSGARSPRRPGSSLLLIALIFSSFLLSLPAFALDPSLKPALKKIADPKLSVCLPAIESLGHSRSPEVADTLAAALLTEKRPIVRRYLVDALGLLRQPSTAAAVIQALRDPDPQTRVSATIALEAIGTPESEKALFNQAAQENEFSVKAHLVHVMGRSSNPKAQEPLKTLTNDDDDAISQMAQDELDNKTKTGKK